MPGSLGWLRLRAAVVAVAVVAAEVVLAALTFAEPPGMSMVPRYWAVLVAVPAELVVVVVAPVMVEEVAVAALAVAEPPGMSMAPRYWAVLVAVPAVGPLTLVVGPPLVRPYHPPHKQRSLLA
jgi:hypothetical protein